LGELEYELDNADELFLAALNGRIKARFAQSRQLRSRSSNKPSSTKSLRARREKVGVTVGVTDDMLEQLIDGLEKEAFFGHGLRQMRDNTMGGMLCCVCNDHEGDSGDALVLCDGCNMAVHQHCYGIHELPVSTWLCTRCVHRKPGAVCVLCGDRYGGMKPTTDGQWVHVLCALWFPEVSCKDTYLRDPVSGIEKIHSDRWNKVCVSIDR
jgi:PHD-zinc-finger like domain/PHD-finger